MRVIFITHYTTLYGANRSLLDLIDGLKQLGVTSLVVAPDTGDITWALQNRGISVYLAGVELWVDEDDASGVQGEGRRSKSWGKRCVGAISRFSKNLWCARRCRDDLRSWSPDLVYSNSSATPFGAMLALLLRVPHVWHVREFLDLHYGYRFDWGRLLFRWALRKAKARIAVSKALRDYHLSAAKSQTHVIYNGIAMGREFDHWRTEAQLADNQQGPYTFACIGLVCPAKGQDEAVRALALLNREDPQARLLIVGAGFPNPVKKLVDELGVNSRVEFRGDVRNMNEIYRECDAVLMCSRNEGMGRVTAEAMAHCLPVIGTDSGGTPELVKTEQSGLLYVPGDVNELAICMRRLVENPRFGKQMGLNGWQFARTHFTIETYSNAVYEVLSAVMKSAKARSG